MLEFDTALTAKGIDICALQEIRRDGFFTFKTENYVVHYFGECSGRYGVGFAVHERLEHLTSAPRGITDSNGRLMTLNIVGEPLETDPKTQPPRGVKARKTREN